LRSLAAPYTSLCIAGNAKNAGKTTVLNELVKAHPDWVLGLSSIGLDGEEEDIVSFLPKPRVHLPPGSLAGIAEDCLRQTEAELEVLARSGVMTAMGEVLITRTIRPGNCLLGGPSTVQGMDRVLALLFGHGAQKLLIDGAFSRQSHAAVGEGLVYVVGAHQSPVMEQVVGSAALALRKLSLPGVPEHLNFLMDERRVGWLDGDLVFHPFYPDGESGFCPEWLEQLPKDAAWLYMPGAVGEDMLAALVSRRRSLHCGFIVHSPLSLVMGDTALRKLFLLDRPLRALKPVKVAFVAINPVSPGGYQFDAAAFMAALSKATGYPVINAMEE